MVDFWIFMALLVLLAIVLGIPIVLVMLVGVRQRLNNLENAVEKILWERNNADKAKPAPTPVEEPAYVSEAEPVKPAPQPEIQPIQAQSASVPETENPPNPPPLPATPRVSEEQALLDQLKAMYETDQPADTPAPAKSARSPEAKLGLFERLERRFVSSNVPVNVGVVVLLAGVAALIKYASDQGILHLSIELRLSAISLASLAALVFAWNKRHTHRLFSLSMQGGAIGILLLVVFAAYKLYRLLPSSAAFILSVGLIAGLAVLAVLQYSRALAVLGILAGFLAPIWLSDGRGNHVGLFTWYTLVNAGIFAMAWLRPWRGLNVLGFAFTWGIGLVWGVLQYSTEKFVSSQAFLLLFFLFYLVIPLLYARRAEPISSGQARIDGTLVFGTPLVAFSLQSGLLAQRWPLALCALGLALVYLALAYTLHQRARRWQHLTQAYAILAVGFATLAVPLALSAQATASIFALEGAGLVWLGLAQRNQLAHWSGIGLQLAAAFSWILGLDSVSIHSFSVITNAMCISGVLIALSGFVITWLYNQHDEVRPLALIPYLWGFIWWLGIWAREISVYKTFHYLQYDQPWRFELNALLLLFGFSAWLVALAQQRITTVWQPNTQTLAHAINVLSGSVLFCLLLAFVMALAQYGASPCGNVLAEKLTRSGLRCASTAPGVINGGTWVWLLFALLGLHSLYLLRLIQSTLPGHSQLIWLLLWASVWMLEVLSRQWIDGWYGLMLALPWLVLVTLSIYRWHWLCWPLGVRFDPWRKTVQTIGLTVLGLWWLIWLFNAGNSAPLPWVVVLNPLDLAEISVLLLLALCLHQWAKHAPVPLALAALVLITVMTLRAVHHWGNIPWNGRLFSSGLTQTSLTVVWSLLGMAGWIIGSKRGLWGLWLSGLSLMGVVLLKLLLIDRSNLGDILGIVAFIIYGLFCIVIGGLAPMPARRTVQESEQP